MTKTGILVHVYHLGAEQWEDLAWGRPGQDELGTLTKFADMLLDMPPEETASSVIFSGPSEQDGLTEGAYAKQYLLDRVEKLGEFACLQSKLDRLTSGEYDLFRQRLAGLAVGPVIKNTVDEVVHAANYFNDGQHDRPADTVLQIAVPSHAPRCLKAQLTARRDKHIPRSQPWYVVASDVCFAGSDIDDVVILEPPHRGDDEMARYKPTLAEAIKPYFGLDTAGKQRFIEQVSRDLTLPQAE